MADHDLEVLDHRLERRVPALRAVPLVIVGCIGLALIAGYIVVELGGSHRACRV